VVVFLILCERMRAQGSSNARRSDGALFISSRFRRETIFHVGGSSVARFRASERFRQVQGRHLGVQKKTPQGLFLIILTRHSLVGHDFLSLVVAFSYLGKVIDGNSTLGNNAFISVGVDIK